MTTRSDRAKAIARRVSERVAAIASPELGLQAAVWDAVDSASDCFLEALQRWESNATPSTEQGLRDEVTAAANDVIAAWREVAAAVSVPGQAMDVPCPEVAHGSGANP